jgi:hypothetical protein
MPINVYMVVLILIDFRVISEGVPLVEFYQYCTFTYIMFGILYIL